MRIRLTTNDYIFFADLTDTLTSKALYDALPISGSVSTWGDEIYFRAPFYCELENDAKAEVNVGDLAYWPDMPAICIFFGPTPISTNEKPIAAGPVNFIGRIENMDVEKLKKIRYGQDIIIEAV